MRTLSIKNDWDYSLLGRRRENVTPAIVEPSRAGMTLRLAPALSDRRDVCGVSDKYSPNGGLSGRTKQR